MSTENRILQLFYAGALADSVSHYEKAGILGTVTETKLKQQQAAAQGQLKQLEINSVQELFAKFSKIFGCIEWKTETDRDSVKVSGKSCLLCSIAKTMKTAQPCHLYCINPLKSLSGALNPSYSLRVNDTLWEGEKCEFVLKEN